MIRAKFGQRIGLDHRQGIEIDNRQGRIKP